MTHLDILSVPKIHVFRKCEHICRPWFMGHVFENLSYLKICILFNLELINLRSFLWLYIFLHLYYKTKAYENLDPLFIILLDIVVLFFRPQELDFKYVMKVSSLKKRLPEAAFRKQNYLERKGLLKCSNTLLVLGFVLVIVCSIPNIQTCTLLFHLKWLLKESFVRKL